jgi:hypothetical protein
MTREIIHEAARKRVAGIWKNNWQQIKTVSGELASQTRNCTNEYTIHKVANYAVIVYWQANQLLTTGYLLPYSAH